MLIRLFKDINQIFNYLIGILRYTGYYQSPVSVHVHDRVSWQADVQF